MTSNNVLIPDPEKKGNPHVHADRLAADEARPAVARVGRPSAQVLSHRHANDLVGCDPQSLDWDARVWDLRVSDAETVRQHGVKCIHVFPPRPVRVGF